MRDPEIYKTRINNLYKTNPEAEVNAFLILPKVWAKLLININVFRILVKYKKLVISGFC
jgi:hypothetical protein